MSNLGQVALTIGGTILGAAVGFPQLGFVLGSLAGQALFPTKLPGTSGPRLQDNRTTIATIGATLEEIYGTDAGAGNVIFLGELNEQSNTEEVGGKGGPTQTNTTYSYSQSIAIGICRGPMGGLLRVWENGALLYDVRPQQEEEGDDLYEARLAAAVTYEETFVLYLGAEDQMPSPTIQAAKGVENTPAFRGLMFIEYPNRALKEAQGLRHPTFKFEVYEEGENCDQLLRKVGIIDPWSAGSDPRNGSNVHAYFVASTGNNSIRGDNASYPMYLNPDPPFSSLSAARTAAAAFPYVGTTYVSYATLQDPDGSLSTGKLLYMGGHGVGPPGSPYDSITIYMHYARSGAPGAYVYGAVSPDIGPPPSIDLLDGAGGLSHTVMMNDFFSGGGFAAGAAKFTYTPGLVGDIPPQYDGAVSRGDDTFYFIESNTCIGVSRVERAPVGYTRVEDASNFYQLQTQNNAGPGGIGEFGGGVQRYPVGPVLDRSVDGDELVFSQEFWEARYAEAVDAGTMPEGLTWNVHYPVNVSYAYERTGPCGSGSPVSLASIVRRICARCGLDPDTQVVATDLDERFVQGYKITRAMSGRDAIEPLRSVGFFDGVESGTVLKFTARGAAAVRTLTLADLGAHEGTGSADPAVKTREIQESDLPRRIRVHYRAPSRDYEDGEQDSPERETSDADQLVDVELAVALDDTQAKQVAEVLWADAWAGRYSHEIDLGAEHFDLEPTDPIVVPVDGHPYRMRIGSLDLSIPHLAHLELLREQGSEQFSSFATAPAPRRRPSSMTVLTPTTLILLDLPALRSEDDDAGVYAAARASGAGTWRGASIHRSTDAGATWGEVGSLANEASTGTVTSAAGLDASGGATWDDENALVVTLLSGSLESRTDEDVLAGANAAAVGIAGRWQVLQFGNVEQLSATSYRLTHLLQGRKGTEHLIGTGQAGDSFVLVSGPGVVRLALEDSDIGVAQLLRAVTFGSTFTSATDVPFTPTGAALVPYSPVGLTLEAGTLTWQRRDRLSQTLQGGALPMSEASEAYEVDLLSGPVVTDTLEVTSPAASIPGSPTRLRVYQISAAVGRGTPGVLDP